jgi:hypothetical protein
MLTPRVVMHYRLNHHGDATRPEHLIDRLRDLRRHSLLNLQPFGENLDQTREFRNTDHAAVWQIGNVGTPMMGATWCSQCDSKRMSRRRTISS